jgi:translation elongation factor EF-G
MQKAGNTSHRLQLKNQQSDGNQRWREDAQESLREGLEASFQRGLYGLPIVDVVADVEHVEVDSFDNAVVLQKAVYNAVVQMMNEPNVSSIQLLEPVMKVEVGRESAFRSPSLSLPSILFLFCSFKRRTTTLAL